MAKKRKKTKKELAQSRERKEALFRILVLIISGIILALWRYLIYVLVIINFFIALFAGKRNKDIAEFCEYWNTEIYKFVHYITFVSNDRPFPFSGLKKLKKFN